MALLLGEDRPRRKQKIHFFVKFINGSIMIGSLISAGISVASKVIGGIKSAQANKRAAQLLKQQQQDNENWRNIERSQDYTQRSDAQAAITRQRELLDEYASRSRATNVVAGGSEASIASQQQAAASSLAETGSNLATAAAQHKDAVEKEYRDRKAQLSQQQVEMYQQQAQQAAQAGAQGGESGMSGIAAFADGLLKKKS